MRRFSEEVLEAGVWLCPIQSPIGTTGYSALYFFVFIKSYSTQRAQHLMCCFEHVQRRYLRMYLQQFCSITKWLHCLFCLLASRLDPQVYMVGFCRGVVIMLTQYFTHLSVVLALSKVITREIVTAKKNFHLTVSTTS